MEGNTFGGENGKERGSSTRGHVWRGAVDRTVVVVVVVVIEYNSVLEEIIKIIKYRIRIVRIIQD